MIYVLVGFYIGEKLLILAKLLLDKNLFIDIRYIFTEFNEFWNDQRLLEYSV